jgi:hypothetical protein
MHGDDVEDLTLPVWPTLKAFGLRTRSAAYDAVKHLPPEAVIRVGVLIRLSRRWVEKRTSGQADVLSAEEFLKLLADDGVRRALAAMARQTAAAPPPVIRRRRGRPRRQAA